MKKPAVTILMSLWVCIGCDGGAGGDAPGSDATRADASPSAADAGAGAPAPPDAASPCPTPQQVDMLDDVADTWTAFVDLGADGVCTLVADTEFTLDTVVFHHDELDEPAARYFISAIQPWSLSSHDSGCAYDDTPPGRLECSAGQSAGPKQVRLENLDDRRTVDMTTSMDRDSHRLTLVTLSAE